MVTEQDVRHIADLADIGIEDGGLAPFTQQFNAILGYFDILDQVPAGDIPAHLQVNVMREDRVAPSLAHDDVLKNAPASENGFIRAPRVM